jgi:hypothetical protein
VRYPYVLLLAVFVAGAAHGADIAISTRSIAPTAAQPRDAVVVALGDGFLALWTEGPMCLSQEIRGIRLDRDGHPRDARSFSVAPVGYQPRIVATASEGDEAYIAWYDTFLPGIQLTRVGADGTLTLLTDSAPRGVMSVSNGNILFVDLQGSLRDSLTATLLDRTGVVVRSGVKVVEQTASITKIDLVAVNGTFLVTWMSGDSHMRAASISPADVAANDVRVTPADLGVMSNSYSMALASDGVHSMVFWIEWQSTKYAVRARSLSSSGTPMDAGPVTVGSIIPTGDPLAALAVSDGYYVLFQEAVNDVNHPVFLRVSFDGTLQSVSRPTQRMALAKNGGRTMAVWTENRFAMTEFFSPFAGYETVAAPIAADGSIGAGTVVSLDFAEQHVRKLLPFAGGTIALWTEGTPNDRVVVSRLTPAGQPADGGLRLRESLFNQSHSTLATDGERLFVAWTEGDEGKPQRLYGAVVSPDSALSASVKQLASDSDGESDIAVVWNGQTFTVVYQRLRNGRLDFAALRVDRSVNAVDPVPISLTPTYHYDENPRLSWNGSEYLLVWQRWYDPFFYFGPGCFSKPDPYPAELFAQRFSEAFAPSGELIELARTTDYNDDLLNVQDDDVSFAGGLWLVIWVDKAKNLTSYARIDANGVRLDPLNGQQLLGSYYAPILVPAPNGWTIAGHEAYGPAGAGRGLTLARIDLNGVATSLSMMALSGTSAIEAVALTPVPLVAYKRFSSSAAYVVLLTQRSRAVHH